MELPTIHTPPANILVGVLAIDRDSEHIDSVHDGIKKLSSFCQWDILIVCREKDQIARRQWSERGARVVTIPDYELETSRHNYWRIAEKRKLVCKHGREGDYDAVLFVDSDVVVERETLADLFECSRHADIVVVPYKIRWSDGYTVGRLQGGKIELMDARELLRESKYPRIHGGSMGCTLIHARALDVPFYPMRLGIVTGEDIGFFYHVLRYRPELTVRITSQVAHHII
jgi:hypothetical protein